MRSALNSNSNTVNSGSPTSVDPRDVGGVDDRRAEGAQGGDGTFGDGVGLGAEAEHAGAPHPDPRPLQPVGVQKLPVVPEEWPLLRCRRGSLGSTPVSAPSTRGRVGHRPAPWVPTTSWLWAMGTTPERLVSPRVGLMPTIPLVEEGHTIDPSVSVPRRRRREVGRDRGARPRAGPARVVVQDVGVRALAGPAAPPAGGLERSEVRPLREVRLAKDDRARLAQSARP